MQANKQTNKQKQRGGKEMKIFNPIFGNKHFIRPEKKEDQK